MSANKGRKRMASEQPMDMVGGGPSPEKGQQLAPGVRAAAAPMEEFGGGGGEHHPGRGEMNNGGRDEDEPLSEGEYEDPFPDEFEDEVVVMGDEEDQEGQGEMETGGGGSAAAEEQAQQRVFRSGVDVLAPGESLDYDPTTYLMYHKLCTTWPCLSFDILRDGLGMYRARFPHTAYLAVGTQARDPSKNLVMLLKASTMHKTRFDQDAPDTGLDLDQDDDNGTDDDAVLEQKVFRHQGGVNRIRSMPQSPNMLATWSDNSTVYLWDVQHRLRALDTPPNSRLPAVKPVFSFKGHSDEGFAMDWSPVVAGQFASGDNAKDIYVWHPQEGGSWAVDSAPYQHHTSSVEDIQWSPVENTVFASCSADRTIRIWDTRAHDRAMAFVAAGKVDVNVISWNRGVQHLLASGSDDGSIKVWDLRNFKSSEPAAHFKWHHQPITSVEWHPTDHAVMAAASADDSISIWDMGLEEDEGAASGADIPEDMVVPPQLLFVHQGQQSIKELHFHPQIPSMIISTALDGFNFFIPANMEEVGGEEAAAAAAAALAGGGGGGAEN